MKAPRSRSLQWLLVRRLVLLQAAMLAIFIALCAAAFWIANPSLLADNEAAAAALKDAVDREPDGRLVVRETEALRQFRESFPHIWYIIRDKTGQSVRSERAVANLRRICGRLGNRCVLTVVDVLERPELAEREKVLATPTVVRTRPLPRRRIIGDLSDEGKVLLELDLPLAPNDAEVDATS
jgi:hypothetical protein